MKNKLQPITEILSKDEQAQFDHHLANVKVALQASGIGRESLAVIRDQRLYRAKYKNYDEFCRIELGHSRRRADQKIAFHKLQLKQLANGQPLSTKEPRSPKSEKRVSQTHNHPIIDVSSETQNTVFSNAPQETEKHVSQIATQSSLSHLDIEAFHQLNKQALIQAIHHWSNSNQFATPPPIPVLCDHFLIMLNQYLKPHPSISLIQS